ncbi:MAG TPA: HAMP domain-containing sensor histidine kinase [Rhodopila sp.]|nr:HAMP domain-containing sensor histidine kinase [Rhodopila sp.]
MDDASSFLRAAMPPASGPSTLMRRSARRLVPVIYAATALVFVVDLLRANLLAFGFFYTPMVATAVFYKSRSSVWTLAAIAIAMVLVGTFIPPISSNVPDLIGNRILSVIAIIATAVFIQYARDTQDRLAEQARRLEAAERAKSDVLTTLSHEMRTPLYKLLSILSLMAATCRPDQRDSLGQVRNGAQHLLDSINNIIDLSELDERRFHAEPVDLRSIGQEAADQAQIAARERQITIVPPDHGEPMLAQADGWATRRIIDNLLTHAILATPAGGQVSIVLGRKPGLVTAAVNDVGPALRLALAPDLAQDLAAEADGLASGMIGTGLILGRRLALAMGGQIAALESATAGTMLLLSLPAAC